MTTAQRVLFTIAGIIFVGLFIYSLASGEFAEASVLTKTVRVLLAPVGVVWVWKAWTAGPPAIGRGR